MGNVIYATEETLRVSTYFVRVRKCNIIIYCHILYTTHTRFSADGRFPTPTT